MSLQPARATLGANHTRGIILGTTNTSIDIGLPNQDDVHFDMALHPSVVIAEPSDARSLGYGADVAVVTTGDAAHLRAFGAIVVPKAIDLFERGRIAWDRPKGSTLTFGAIVERGLLPSGNVRITIASGRNRTRIAFEAATPVATIREGSREAFLSPQHCFVFSNSEPDGISDRVDRVIVADGTMAVPL